MPDRRKVCFENGNEYRQLQPLGKLSVLKPLFYAIALSTLVVRKICVVINELSEREITI